MFESSGARRRRSAWGMVAGMFGVLLVLFGGGAWAVESQLSFPGGSLSFAGEGDAPLAAPLKVLLALTLLSLAPAMLVVLTAFTRIIIVLSMLRHALGMPQTPPNVVLVSLAIFLTIFTMMPAWQAINEQALTPYLDQQLTDREFVESAIGPLRDFMARQTREADIRLMLRLAQAPVPESIDQLSMFTLVPAFMLSELRTAFEIGFIIFLPFVVIDIIVASTLMSLGMIMVPPLALSLPLKVLMFVLIDGWRLLTESLVRSFGI